MASVNVRDLEWCLSIKLRAVERPASVHRVFEIYDDAGQLIATTALSRSWRGTTALGANMVAAIRRELGLRHHTDGFAQLIACPLARDDYLALVSLGESED